MSSSPRNANITPPNLVANIRHGVATYIYIYIYTYIRTYIGDYLLLGLWGRGGGGGGGGGGCCDLGGSYVDGKETVVWLSPLFVVLAIREIRG